MAKITLLRIAIIGSQIVIALVGWHTPFFVPLLLIACAIIAVTLRQIALKR